jgi:hypothetical protein
MGVDSKWWFLFGFFFILTASRRVWKIANLGHVEANLHLGLQGVGSRDEMGADMGEFEAGRREDELLACSPFNHLSTGRLPLQTGPKKNG